MPPPPLQLDAERAQDGRLLRRLDALGDGLQARYAVVDGSSS